jgi:hypothetical protein
MKMTRWDWGEDYMHECSYGDWCKSEDVAELEAKCAELGAKYAELKALNVEMLDIIESLHHCSDYWSEYMEKVIAKAGGGANE